MSNEKELTPKEIKEIEKIKTHPKQPVTQAAYARYVGVTRQYINELVRDGIVILKNGKVIPHDADIAIREATDSSRAGEQDESPETLQQHKIEKAKHDARLAKLKADEAEGKVATREQVDDFYFRIVRNARNGFESLPKNMAQDLGLDHDKQQKLTAEIRRILTELDRALKAGE